MIWMIQSFVGLLLDATVGQVVRALGAAPSGGPLLLPPAPWPPDPVDAGRGPGPGGALVPSPAAGWEPAPRDPVAPPGRWRDQDLRGDDVKLVRYTLVSLRACHERILESGEVVVTEDMTGEGFATWRVAAYLASSGREIRREDRRSLRVSWEVFERWPRVRGSGCKQGETEALREIRDTLRGLPWGRPWGRVRPAADEGPAAEVVAWDGSGTPSQVQARGSVILTKRWNGTSYDVTLDGRLAIHSRSYGHVRHGLPPGYLPQSADPHAYPCAVQRHATRGDTSGVDNYGGRGVHLRRDDYPGYEGRATLWFPELSSGEFTLRCTWQTSEV